MARKADVRRHRTAGLVLIAVIAAIGSCFWGGTNASSSLAIMPDSFPSTILADTQFDPWRVTNFIGPMARINGGRKPAAGNPGGEALRIIVPEKRDDIWDVSVYSLNLRPVQKGDVIQAAVWLRLSPTQGNPATARVRLLIQGKAVPYEVVAARQVTLDRGWQRFEVSGTAGRAYAPGQAVVTVHLATGKQTVDVGHGQLFRKAPGT
jgi:hypothetical protein